MPIFPIFGRRAVRRAAERARQREATPAPAPPGPAPSPPAADVRRHFYNEPTFQTYASFFALWGGWATAGHCLTEASGVLPDWARGEATSWPDGLDAALIGCTPPRTPPTAPRRGVRVVARGYPAGSTHAAERTGTVYLARMPGQWIVQLDDGCEPVVTGMSGGPVRDAVTGEPLGILVTRNSPADLDRDGDADESFDFTALDAVWEAVNASRIS